MRGGRELDGIPKQICCLGLSWEMTDLIQFSSPFLALPLFPLLLDNVVISRQILRDCRKHRNWVARRGIFIGRILAWTLATRFNPHVTGSEKNCQFAQEIHTRTRLLCQLHTNTASVALSLLVSATLCLSASLFLSPPYSACILRTRRSSLSWVRMGVETSL